MAEQDIKSKRSSSEFLPDPVEEEPNPSAVPHGLQKDHLWRGARRQSLGSSDEKEDDSPEGVPLEEDSNDGDAYAPGLSSRWVAGHQRQRGQRGPSPEGSEHHMMAGASGGQDLYDPSGHPVDDDRDCLTPRSQDDDDLYNPRGTPVEVPEAAQWFRQMKDEGGMSDYDAKLLEAAVSGKPYAPTPPPNTPVKTEGSLGSSLVRSAFSTLYEEESGMDTTEDSLLQIAANSALQQAANKEMQQAAAASSEMQHEDSNEWQQAAAASKEMQQAAGSILHPHRKRPASDLEGSEDLNVVGNKRSTRLLTMLLEQDDDEDENNPILNQENPFLKPEKLLPKLENPMVEKQVNNNTDTPPQPDFHPLQPK
jgi:hypothetical protein